MADIYGIRLSPIELILLIIIGGSLLYEGLEGHGGLITTIILPIILATLILIGIYIFVSGGGSNATAGSRGRTP